MFNSYITEDIDAFYMLIGILVSCGYGLDFDAMKHYQESHSDSFLILIKE